MCMCTCVITSYLTMCVLVREYVYMRLCFQIAGVVYDFDILGVYYGTTRKALRNQLTSEEQLALEHAKRDRVLAYVLTYIMGQYLVRTGGNLRRILLLNSPRVACS